jgi:hypothetical protein
MPVRLNVSLILRAAAQRGKRQVQRTNGGFLFAEKEVFRPDPQAREATLAWRQGGNRIPGWIHGVRNRADVCLRFI